MNRLEAAKALREKTAIKGFSPSNEFDYEIHWDGFKLLLVIENHRQGKHNWYVTDWRIVLRRIKAMYPRH